MEHTKIQECPVSMEKIKKYIIDERHTTEDIYNVAIEENWTIDTLDFVIKIKMSADNDVFNDAQTKIYATLVDIYDTISNKLNVDKTQEQEVENQEENIELNEDYYLKEIQKEPFSAKLHHDYATFLFDNNRKEESLKEDYESTKIDRNNSEVHRCIADTLDDLGREQEAILEYKTAISISPDYVDAYFNLCQLYLKLGNIEEAKKMSNMVKLLEK